MYHCQKRNHPKHNKAMCFYTQCAPYSNSSGFCSWRLYSFETLFIDCVLWKCNSTPTVEAWAQASVLMAIYIEHTVHTRTTQLSSWHNRNIQIGITSLGRFSFGWIVRHRPWLRTNSQKMTSYVFLITFSWPRWKTSWGQGRMWRRIHKDLGRENRGTKRRESKCTNTA